MLRSIIAAVGRAVAIALKVAYEVALIPIRSVLAAFFPGLAAPLPMEDELAANFDSLPRGDPFADAEETLQAREIETNAVIAWAADSAHSGAELTLPDVRPKVRDWLASLSDDELDALVLAGKQDVYAHLHFSMPVAGLPQLDERGSRVSLETDPSLRSGFLWAAMSPRAC